MDPPEGAERFAHYQVNDVHVGDLCLGPNIEDADVDRREPTAKERAFGIADFRVEQQRFCDRGHRRMDARAGEEPVDTYFHLDFFERQDADRQADIRRERVELAVSELVRGPGQAEVVVHTDVPDIKGLDVGRGGGPIGRRGCGVGRLTST